MERAICRVVIGSATVLAFLCFTSGAFGQTTDGQTGRTPGRGGVTNLADRLSKDAKPSAPAPKRDLNGAWAGPVDSVGHNFALFTPLGEQRFRQNKPEPVYHLANTNDPLTTCDPLGFPRNILNETRGMRFAQLTDRVIVLYQYQRVWREIWTDGRELPKSIDTKDGAPSRWYGYSVGHWDGDSTFVIDSVGMDERTWLDKAGHPHSADMRVQERYTRVDHDTLHMSVTIDDPKVYASPFEELSNVTFKWIPDQDLEEQLCVPSEGIAYMDIIGHPGGNADSAK